MKKILILSLLLLSQMVASAQQLEGVYKNENDSIIFMGDKVSFRITGFAGLSTVQVGEGSYELIENFMLINTTDYPGHKTSYTSQDAISEDTCRVRVVSIDNYPVQGILVESKNSSGKVLNAGVTDSNGSVIFTDFDKIGKITAFAMGYHPITFDFSMGKDYIIKIAENDIIENRTVAFRINIIDDKSFSILLLSDDLKTNKDLEKELTKLNKRASKSNLIEKRFTKELPIFIR